MSSSEALRAELEYRCLSGLGEVAGALAGEDPAVVCETFERWETEARRPWPWLAGMCWAALEPLGLAFPSGDRDAVVAGRLLVGTETDPLAVLTAIEALREREPPPHGASATAGGSSQAVMQHRRLTSAVDAFWASFLRATRRLHEHVREGDREGADDLVVSTRRRLEELAERVAHLADSSMALVTVGDRPGMRPTGGGLPSTILVDGEPTGPLVIPDAVAKPSRPARRQPSGGNSRRPGPKPKRPGDGYHRYERSRQYRYLPVAFAVLAVLAAIYQLSLVASS